MLESTSLAARCQAKNLSSELAGVFHKQTENAWARPITWATVAGRARTRCTGRLPTLNLCLLLCPVAFHFKKD